MKSKLILYSLVLFFASCHSYKLNKSTANNLIGTKWHFVGIHYKNNANADVLQECPKEIHYEIHFNTYNTISGMATVPFSGKYTIKPDSVLECKAYISKGKVDEEPKGEFDWRLLLIEALLGKRTYRIRDNQLIIDFHSGQKAIFSKIGSLHNVNNGILQL